MGSKYRVLLQSEAPTLDTGLSELRGIPGPVTGVVTATTPFNVLQPGKQAVGFREAAPVVRMAEMGAISALPAAEYRSVNRSAGQRPCRPRPCRRARSASRSTPGGPPSNKPGDPPCRTPRA